MEISIEHFNWNKTNRYFTANEKDIPYRLNSIKLKKLFLKNPKTNRSKIFHLVDKGHNSNNVFFMLFKNDEFNCFCLINFPKE